MTPEQRESTIAMIHLDTCGSTTYPPPQWNGYRWAETDYAPEWLSESDLDCEPDNCVTVLDYSLSEPRCPKGWEIAYQYQAGEHDCPDCHRRQENDREDYESQPLQKDCQLCEGDGVIYSGEECSVVVFRPKYVYGSGSFGCLYDCGPHRCANRQDAVDFFLDMFGDALVEGEEQRLTEALLAGCRHDFEDREAAGADYCECS